MPYFFNDILRIPAGRRIGTSRSACNHIQRVTQNIAQDNAQHLCRGARHSKTPAFTADNRLRMVLISTISAPHPSSCCVISCNSSKGIKGFSSRALPRRTEETPPYPAPSTPCTRSSAACVPRQEPSSGDRVSALKAADMGNRSFICPYFVTTTPSAIRSPRQSDAAFAICHAAFPCCHQNDFSGSKAIPFAAHALRQHPAKPREWPQKR